MNQHVWKEQPASDVSELLTMKECLICRILIPINEDRLNVPCITNYKDFFEGNTKIWELFDDFQNELDDSDRSIWIHLYHQFMIWVSKTKGQI